MVVGSSGGVSSLFLAAWGGGRSLLLQALDTTATALDVDDGEQVRAQPPPAALNVMIRLQVHTLKFTFASTLLHTHIYVVWKKPANRQYTPVSDSYDGSQAQEVPECVWGRKRRDQNTSRVTSLSLIHSVPLCTLGIFLLSLTILSHSLSSFSSFWHKREKERERGLALAECVCLLTFKGCLSERERNNSCHVNTRFFLSRKQQPDFATLIQYESGICTTIYSTSYSCFNTTLQSSFLYL